MHGDNQTSEPAPHLAPALTALVLAVVVLAAFGSYARSLEARSIDALATAEAVIDPHGDLYRLKNQGTALQEAAFETGDLLPLYGSSELKHAPGCNRPFHPTNLFRDRPTDFAVFPVGKEAATCLIIQQKLAAVGPALRGRKVVVSLSPFLVLRRAYGLGRRLRGEFLPSACRRTGLQYTPESATETGRRTADAPVLRRPWRIGRSSGSPWRTWRTALSSPSPAMTRRYPWECSRIQSCATRITGTWCITSWKHPVANSSPVSPHGGRPLDWTALHRRAAESYRAQSDNNEFGLDNQRWNRFFRQEMARQKNTRTDEEFLRTLRGEPCGNGSIWSFSCAC